MAGLNHRPAGPGGLTSRGTRGCRASLVSSRRSRCGSSGRAIGGVGGGVRVGQLQERARAASEAASASAWSVGMICVLGPVEREAYDHGGQAGRKGGRHARRPRRRRESAARRPAPRRMRRASGRQRVESSRSSTRILARRAQPRRLTALRGGGSGRPRRPGARTRPAPRPSSGGPAAGAPAGSDGRTWSPRRPCADPISNG